MVSRRGKPHKRFFAIWLSSLPHAFRSRLWGLPRLRVVGDMIILIGVLLATCLLALGENVPALALLRVVSGVVLMLAVLIVSIFAEAINLLRGYQCQGFL